MDCLFYTFMSKSEFASRGGKKRRKVNQDEDKRKRKDDRSVYFGRCLNKL